MNPFAFDWGNVTPEFVDEKTNTAIHVVNHNLELKENILRTENFLVARIQWFKYHLPEGFSQKVIVDARGQSVTYETLKKMKIRILNRLMNIELIVEFRM